jgi:tRNA uridine 5-carbamoylmethylation protein Kti12
MLIVLFGPAGAGKTSIADRLTKQLPNTYMISSDKFKRQTYDRIMREVEQELGRHKYIVVDGTFYKKNWRDRLREIIGSRDSMLTIFVDCSLKTCLIRNRERTAVIPEKAIYTIWHRFERPKRPDVYINTDNFSIEEATNRILQDVFTKKNADD